MIHVQAQASDATLHNLCNYILKYLYNYAYVIKFYVLFLVILNLVVKHFFYYLIHVHPYWQIERWDEMKPIFKICRTNKGADEIKWTEWMR